MTAMKTVITCPLLTILRLRSAFILIAFALSAFVLARNAQAVSPPPDAGMPAVTRQKGKTLF
jgi:hypothetical protein